MKDKITEYGAYVGIVVLVGGVIALFALTEPDSPEPIKTTNTSTQSVPLTTQETTTMLKGSKLADFAVIEEPVTELQVIDIVEGTGEEVSATATITAHYTGAYAVNGEIFESSIDSGKTFTSPLSNLIAGWGQGLPGMKAGGTRRLIIPGNLAYGEAPEGYTPGAGGRPLGTLVFDIEVFSTVD